MELAPCTMGLDRLTRKSAGDRFHRRGVQPFNRIWPRIQARPHACFAAGAIARSAWPGAIATATFRSSGLGSDVWWSHDRVRPTAVVRPKRAATEFRGKETERRYSPGRFPSGDLRASARYARSDEPTGADVERLLPVVAPW